MSSIKKGVVTLAVLGAVAVGASAVAGAASNSSGTANSGNSSSQGVAAQGSTAQGGPAQGSTAAPSRPPADPATMSHGPGETLLTDGTADKVKQAALDKVPGATVIRVETDSEGSPYEAHLRKSDGTEVTVKVDKDYNATDVQTGFGGH
jgi:uncharacterized membrane protein YkoI